MTRIREARALRAQLEAWLRDRLAEAGLRGFIFGLSGGLDSAVVCGLAAGAAGRERCLALIMPIESDPEDARLARLVADRFGVQAIELDLSGQYRSLIETLGAHREPAERMAGGTVDPAEVTATIATRSAEALAVANVKSRLRMVTLYYYANLLGYMVLGSSNRDEFQVGYFTKWGDNAADAFPLGDLVKREVRDLARVLGVPDEIVSRAPSAGLWPGQTDEAELGFTYEELDRFLVTGTSGNPSVDSAIRERLARSRHKSAPPPVARPH